MHMNWCIRARQRRAVNDAVGKWSNHQRYFSQSLTLINSNCYLDTPNTRPADESGSTEPDPSTADDPHEHAPVKT